MPARIPPLIALLVLLTAGSVAAEDFARVGTFGAQFARIPVDARGEAMGLATTVDPAGPTAFWWNPAPLPEPDRVMASYTIYELVVDELHWRPLAVRASLGNLTMGYLWGPLTSDPMVIRTAYDPDGDGRTFDASMNLHQLSLAADLLPWLVAGTSSWHWTLGANARLYHQRLAEATISTWDLDLGSSLAWSAVDQPDLRLQLHGTAMVRNLLASDLGYDDRPTELPRLYHLGLGLEAGLGSVWRGEHLVVVTLAHTWRRDLEHHTDLPDNELIGAEVLLGGILALRAGHRDTPVYVAEGWSWGLGLQYRFDVWRGLRAAVDYAATEPGDVFGDVNNDHWTFTAGFDLP